LACLAAWLCFAGSSSVWESNTYSDFLKGRFLGVSLTRDGRLTLSPRLETAAETGEAGVWSLAAAPDGAVYFSTGHRGRVYRWKAGEKPALLWSAPQPEVFALALDARGTLYAGSSPDGKVWKFEGGKASEFFDPGEKYIWALAAASDGSLFVGTGQNGRVWRVTAAGQGEIWYETGQTHVTSLAFDPKGRLLAGTEPNGILYRIEGKGRAFVLYDSSLPEIRSIVPAPDGSVYVAAMGGAFARRQAHAAGAAASQQPAGMVTTTITVSADADAAAQRGIDLQPKPEPPKPAAPAPETPPPAPSVDLSAEKSALYRIHPDNLAEILWSSKEENVYDLVVRGAELYFSTDQSGRIYRLSPDLKAALLVETREGETTRLADAAGSLLAATSNQGKLYRLNGADAQTGIYESPVHDAGNAARWGRLEWRAETGAGKFSFRTRSGNSARPDTTWSEWSEPIADPARNAIASPNARFIQWRVEITPGKGPAPVIDSVAISYQPQNGRPVVRSIQVSPQWAAAQAKPATPAQQSSVAYSITVTDTGDAGQSTSSGTPTQTVARTGMQQLYISWQADDPDGDALIYSLYYRGEDEREWKLLKADIKENTFQQDGEVFADGRYFFRVVASDRLANSPQAARESDLVSPPVLIDQTPPRVRILEPRRQGAEWLLEIRAEDSASPIRRAECSVNAGPWTVLEAADGITDSREESFSLRLPAEGGERSVVVRAFDAAGNPGLARIVLR
jgi:sugar lactone lactonase YvrE